MTLSHPIAAFTLGSAIPVKNCTKGVLFVSGKTEPLPSGGWTPPDKPATESGSRMAWWVVGIGALAGLVWYGSKGGVLVNPSGESSTWKASARRDALEKIIGDAGWSFRLADNELRADGAARGHNGMLYLLSSDDGGSFRSPRDPVHVGAYALNDAKDEWLEVGAQTFDNLRSALQGWQSVAVARDNPSLHRSWNRIMTFEGEK